MTTALTPTPSSTSVLTENVEHLEQGHHEKSPADEKMERDLLRMFEVTNGRSYDKLQLSPTERAKRVRGFRRELIKERCGNEAQLAMDMAIYSSTNGPSKLRAIWEQRGAVH